MRSKKKDLIFFQKNFIYSSFCYVTARKLRVYATGLQSDFDFNSLSSAENKRSTGTILLVHERKDIKRGKPSARKIRDVRPFHPSHCILSLLSVGYFPCSQKWGNAIIYVTLRMIRSFVFRLSA